MASPKNPRAESRTSPRRIEATAKQREALKLRTTGMSFWNIAQQLGWKTAYGAQCAIEAALLKTIQAPADEQRKLDLVRLDVMLMAVWARVMGGELDAVATALSILTRRAKLLGLDMPIKIENEGDPLIDNRSLNITIGGEDARDTLQRIVAGIASRNGSQQGDLGALSEGS